LVTGAIDASDKIAAIRQLEQMNLVPVSLTGVVSQDNGKRSVATSYYHLFGLPTIVIALIALALPFFSLSCERQKVVSMTGYNLLSSSIESPSPVTEPSQKQAEESSDFLILMMTVILSAAVVSGISLYLVFTQNRKAVIIGLAAASVGILICCYVGYSVAVDSEREIKANQAQMSIEPAKTPESFEELGNALGEAIGKGMTSAMDITVSMDSGFYLLLFAFLLGISGIVLPYIFRASVARSQVVTGSILGIFLLFCMTIMIAMVVVKSTDQARFASLDELRNSPLMKGDPPNF